MNLQDNDLFKISGSSILIDKGILLVNYTETVYSDLRIYFVANLGTVV